MPTTDVVTVNAGGGADYTSLNAAILAEARNITSSDEIVIFRCSGSTADTTTVASTSWASWVMDSTRYVQIEPASGQEHSGAWNTGVYRLEVTDGNGIGVPTTASVVYHIRVRGIQARVIATTGSTVRTAIGGITSGISSNSIFDVQNCIARVTKSGGTATTHRGIGVPDANFTPTYIGNNLVILEGTSVGSGIVRSQNNANVYVHNCGVVGATTAYNDVANDAAGTMQVKNCWAYQCGTFSAGAGIENSDYNSTDLASASGGANDRVSQTFTFVNAGAGDYRPANDDAAIRAHGVDLGSDPNLAITTDMEGVAVNSPPDIGPLNAEEAEEPPASDNRWRLRRAAA